MSRRAVEAEYFQGTQLMGSAATIRCEPAINYSWGTGGQLGTALAASQFSMRWTATWRIDVAGVYRFTVRAADGVILLSTAQPPPPPPRRRTAPLRAPERRQ